MAPSTTTIPENEQASAQKPLEMQQPSAQQGMNPEQPQPEEPQLGLRGGEGGGMCPGRFCFIIPCPIPINCCIFPCPC